MSGATRMVISMAGQSMVVLGVVFEVGFLAVVDIKELITWGVMVAA